mmetsp:Transcript_4088/g.6053  ORF Transcript_4088/g.6053 Transcript_4088/m.6053 type:complete len:491 (-) Transcript_4088:22-1494(-)
MDAFDDNARNEFINVMQDDNEDTNLEDDDNKKEYTLSDHQIQKKWKQIQIASQRLYSPSLIEEIQSTKFKFTNDIWFNIMTYLQLKEILSMKRVCRTFYRLSFSEEIFFNLVHYKYNWNLKKEEFKTYSMFFKPNNVDPNEFENVIHPTQLFEMKENMEVTETPLTTEKSEINEFPVYETNVFTWQFLYHSLDFPAQLIFYPSFSIRYQHEFYNLLHYYFPKSVAEWFDEKGGLDFLKEMKEEPLYTKELFSLFDCMTVKLFAEQCGLIVDIKCPLFENLVKTRHAIEIEDLKIHHEQHPNYQYAIHLCNNEFVIYSTVLQQMKASFPNKELEWVEIMVNKTHLREITVLAYSSNIEWIQKVVDDFAKRNVKILVTPKFNSKQTSIISLYDHFFKPIYEFNHHGILKVALNEYQGTAKAYCQVAFDQPNFSHTFFDLFEPDNDTLKVFQIQNKVLIVGTYKEVMEKYEWLLDHAFHAHRVIMLSLDRFFM